MLNSNFNNTKKIKNVIFGDFLKYLGGRDITGNYAPGGIAVPTDFIYTAPQRLEVKTVLLYMQDSTQIHYELFGSLPALTNGMRFWYKRTASSSKIYLDAGYAIKTNGGFGRLSFDVELKEKGSGHNVFTGQWDFQKAFGDTLLIEKGGSIGITVSDDLTGLDIFSIFIKGILLY